MKVFKIKKKTYPMNGPSTVHGKRNGNSKERKTHSRGTFITKNSYADSNIGRMTRESFTHDMGVHNSNIAHPKNIVF